MSVWNPQLRGVCVCRCEQVIGIFRCIHLGQQTMEAFAGIVFVWYACLGVCVHLCLGVCGWVEKFCVLSGPPWTCLQLWKSTGVN